jgi:murein L,D-transpeptidase YcbB/YkuD
MDDVSLQVELGRIVNHSGVLSFKIVINGNGSESIQVYAYDPSDMRKSGVFLSLSTNQINDLEKIIAKAKTASTRFKNSQTKSTQHSEQPLLESKDEDEDARRLFDLARTNLKDGDRETTVVLLREIITRHPSTVWATKARKALVDAGMQ